MKLNFLKSEIEKLIELTESAAANTVPYTGEGWKCPKETTPGLMLVGDSGIYFLSNADEQQIDPVTKTLPLAYAEECNPLKMDADSVWENKRAAFGGDDGAEFFTLADIGKWIKNSGGSEYLTLDINPSQIRFLGA